MLRVLRSKRGLAALAVALVGLARAAALMKAQYDVDRARLDLGKRDLISQIEFEEARLALADAEQKQKEVHAREQSTAAAAEADLVGKRRKRDKAQFDVDRTVSGIEA